MNTRRQFGLGLAAFGLAAVFVGAVRADDKKVNVTGTWNWTVTRNDQEIKNVLKLKHEGEKVTGTLKNNRGGNDVTSDIKDAELKDNVLKFSVEREFGGNKVTIKYTGKVDGDKITLEGELERDGETRKMGPWDAKREAGEKG